MKKKTKWIAATASAACAAFLAGCGVELLDDPVIQDPADPYTPPVAEITVDGFDSEDCWGSAPVHTFGIADGATVRLWFGEKGMGIFLTAKDSTYNALKNDPDQCDRMEVFFDPLLNGPRENGKPNWDDIALRLGVNGDFTAWFGHDNNTDGYCWTNSYVDFDFVSLYDEAANSYSQELYVPYKSLNLAGKPDEIGMAFNQVDIIEPLKDWWVNQGVRVNSVMDGIELSDVNAYPLFNNKGERIARKTLEEVFAESDYESYTPRAGDMKRIDTIFTGSGMYVRAIRDTKGKEPALIDPEAGWWSDGWLTSVTVDLDSEDGPCGTDDLRRVQAVIRPSGNYAVSSGGQWVGDWGSSIKLGVRQQSIYNAATSEYAVMAYIPYTAAGMKEASSRVALWPFIGNPDDTSLYVQYDPATGEIVSDPYDGETWEEYLAQFAGESAKFEGAWETELSDGTKLQAKPTADGIYVRRSMNFTNATFPFLLNVGDFYADDAWSKGFVRDLFVDLGGEGGDRCDANDFKITHFIDGRFILFQRSADGTKWEALGTSVQQQGNRKQVDGFKFWIDLNGMQYETANQTGTAWICFYASNEKTGLTDTPEAVGIGINLSAEDEGIPSKYTPVGASKLPPREDATFDGAWTREANGTTLQVKLLSEGIYVRQSLSVDNQTIPSAHLDAGDWWSDGWCKDLIVNFDAGVNRFDSNDYKVTYRPNGDFRLMKHNGSSFADVVSGHWNADPIRGYDFWVDMNGLQYDTANQTGKIWVCFYAEYDKIGLSENPSSVSFYVPGDSAENNVSTYVPVNGSGEYANKNTVFDGAWEAATPSGDRVFAKATEEGVYARVTIPVNNQRIPSMNPSDHWWSDGWCKDLFVNANGLVKTFDGNDYKITYRPNGDFRLMQKSGNGYDDVVKDHWDATPLDGFDFWIDMNGLKYDENGQNGTVYACFFVTNARSGLTQKPEAVGIGWNLTPEQETDPSMWTTLGNKNAVFANAWNSYTVAGNNTVVVAATDDGVYFKVSYKVYSSEVPSVANWDNIWGNSCRHEIFINLDGSSTAFNTNVFKITAMTNGYNRMFRGGGANWDAGELHSDITNRSVAGLEYWTDANGIEYDTANQTGVMWYCVYISYSLGGGTLTQKTSSIGFALNPDGANEMKPETYTVLTDKTLPFANAVKTTMNGNKFEVAADDTAIYVRMAVSVNNENLPSEVNWSNLYGGAHPRDMFINVNVGVTQQNTANLFKITGMENGYNRMFRGGGASWDAGELHSDITNTNNVEGLEYWTDANGLVYDIGGQTGEMWYCFRLTYSLAGLSGKPAQVGIAAGIGEETNPAVYQNVTLN